MLAKTQSHAKFFVTKFRVVRGEILGKIAFVVAGSPVDSAFEQPFPDTILGTTRQLADIVQQRRHMNSIPESSCQRRMGHSLKRFHKATVTWRS